MSKSKEEIVFTVVRVIAIAFLLWAYTNQPIGFYTLLRIVICATCAYGAYYAMKFEKTAWTWTMAFIALLFNPIIPIHLKREHWEIIDAIAAIILLLSIPLIKQSKNIRDEANAMDKNNDKYRDAVITILLGMAFIIGGVLFWYHIAGNPLNEIALIQRAKVATCILVDTYEDEHENEHGHVYVSDVGIYAFRLPDGREFKTLNRVPSGQLEEQLEVEYLPDNPSVNRIKGDGCQSVVEWLWRKIGVGGLFLLICITPGFLVLQDGIRKLKIVNKTKELIANNMS